jgi:hypothetical protein
MMERDEEGTLRLLKKIQRDFIEPETDPVRLQACGLHPAFCARKLLVGSAIQSPTFAELFFAADDKG